MTKCASLFHVKQKSGYGTTQHKKGGFDVLNVQPPRNIEFLWSSAEKDSLSSDSKKPIELGEERGRHPNCPNSYQISSSQILSIISERFDPHRPYLGTREVECSDDFTQECR